jgi:RHS repeat-associated protein
VDVWLERAAEPAGLLDPAQEAPSPVGVANIDYDAKGQRLLIDYKNGASTFYSYDPLTFRLTQLLTKRKAADFLGDDPQPPIDGWPGQQVQNLHYTYDPAGNITHIQDDAQQTVYFRNKRVEPSNDYVYDTLYRLIQADGREHLGQLASGKRKPATAPDGFNAFHTRLDHPGNGQAMGTYTERYVYDAVGNFVQMQHRGSDPVHAGWTRACDYLEASLIEDGNGGALLKTSNRLTSTTLNPAGNAPQAEAYLHDTHGNMLRMPHLGGGSPGPNMNWDYRDQLRQADLGGGGMAFHVYDASGQRVRKVVEKNKGNLIEERIYLGGFEIYRKHEGAVAPSISANTATLERETLHVMDDKQRIALVETRALPRTQDPKDPLQLIRYQFGNHLGSASLELDEKAQIVSYEEYSPYGSSTYQAVRSLTETPKRYRFTGKERDEESGFYYHGARYYAAWLYRWLSCDPQPLADGLDLYNYARDNPIRFSDQNGQYSFDELLVDIGLAEPGPQPATPIPLEYLKSKKLPEYSPSEAGVDLPKVTNAETQAKGISTEPPLRTFKGYYELYREAQERKAQTQLRGTLLVAGAVVGAVAPVAAPLLVETAAVSAPAAAVGVGVAGVAAGTAEEYGLSGKVTPTRLALSAGLSSLAAAGSMQTLKSLEEAAKANARFAAADAVVIARANAFAATVEQGQPQLWKAVDLQTAIDSIHVAVFEGQGRSVPMALTVTPDGRMVVSQVKQIPGKAARERAIALLGKDVQFAGGTARGNAPGVRGRDAEARAIQFLGSDAKGARQVATHFACEYCAPRLTNARVNTLTGTKAVEGAGKIVRPFTYELLPPR